MENSIPTVYDPKTVEQKWYAFWEKAGLFHAEPDSGRQPFCIVIPPPNITGQLHMGHAIDNTLQDILIRWRRMQGYNALWMPGTDHAGIATQAKVEEVLRSQEGKSRYDLGRDEFIRRVWQWKEKYGGRITNQLRRLGASCDWERERFTMDEGCSAAVREVFVALYEKKLIYRSNRMINWCVGCRTALSDIEVEHEEEEGTLWQVRYPLADDASAFITVATTRPETILGDTAVAVHTDDERYQGLKGRQVRLPIVGRVIPIVADEYVDPAFGTGAVKVTPAHDPNDFEMGRRHGLAEIAVIGQDGKMTAAAGEFAGLERYECRKALLERLRAEGWLAGTEAHRHAVGHCQRCGKVVEPLVSLQWFVRMAPLARAALAAVREGHTRFVPERFGKVYENWLENIRDWCISRQIWWGHRIPVWYCASCGQTIASRREVAACPHCEGAARQDEDVLDTWFSSALWPFSTLGWPQDTAELKYFYPTSVLVTGYDIIFFWVARMMFMGMEFKQAAPFRHVFIHGLVRDDKGRKMSKSLGNGIDPLEVVEKYGADSLRFTLVNGNAPGNDMRFYWEKAEASRNFANKIWNAARFVLLNLDDGAVSESAPATLADRWIVSRLERTARELTFSLERYELGEAARLIYEFIWNEFCDWYIELAKPRLYNKEDAAARARARRTLAATLEKALRLLHPFMPFISEELWQALPHQGQSVMAAPWPAGDLSLADAGAEAQMNSLMEVVKAVRNLRAEMNVAPGKKSAVILRAADSEMCALLSDNAGYIRTLAAAETVDVALSGADKPPDAAAAVVAGVEVYLPLKGLLDLDKEIERLNKEQDNLEKEIARLTAKLDNPGFTAKAPPSVVAKEQEKRREYESKLAAVSERVRYLAVLR